jgi:hypothetical protein
LQVDRKTIRLHSDCAPVLVVIPIHLINCCFSVGRELQEATDDRGLNSNKTAFHGFNLTILMGMVGKGNDDGKEPVITRGA